MILAFDIEADDLLRKATTIHLVCVRDVDTGRQWAFRGDRLAEAVDLLNTADMLVAHNGVSYDIPVLQRISGRAITAKCLDTLLGSRLLHPDQTDHPAGGNSLAEWGALLGIPKLDHSDFTAWSPEMEAYCHRDVEITARLYHRFLPDLRKCRDAVRLEHSVAGIILGQHTNGVGFDTEAATTLYGSLKVDLGRLTDELHVAFPAKPKQLKTKVKWIPFNPGSRPQIIERLLERGWKPTEWTKPNKRRKSTKPFVPKPRLTDEIIEDLDVPEAASLVRFLLCQKRVGQIKSWLNFCDNGLIHGDVITNGTVTGRMTHSDPNAAGTPKVSKPYGKECRGFFRPTRPGRKQVGCDASSLELAMLASFLFPYDKGAMVERVRTKQVKVDLPKMLDLPDWATAKNGVYACAYGCRPKKLAETIGCSESKATMLHKRIMDDLKLGPVTTTLKIELAKNKFIRGIDGRPLPSRSEHSILNLALQSAGAVVMKQALVYAAEHPAFSAGRAAFMLNVHDEFQIECEPDIAEEVGRHCVDSIRRAGERFKLACPLSGEFKIGNNWAETH